MNSEAREEAEALIDLQIASDAWFDQPEAGTKEDLANRFRLVDAYEVDPSSADEKQLAFHRACDAVDALYSSGNGRRVLEALGSFVTDAKHPLLRRRVAARILTEGPLEGFAAEAMMASLLDPDPQIVASGLRAVLRVPREMVLSSLEVMRTLRDSSDPEIAKLAEIRLCQFDPALRR